MDLYAAEHRAVLRAPLPPKPFEVLEIPVKIIPISLLTREWVKIESANDAES